MSIRSMTGWLSRMRWHVWPLDAEPPSFYYSRCCCCYYCCLLLLLLLLLVVAVVVVGIIFPASITIVAFFLPCHAELVAGWHRPSGARRSEIGFCIAHP
ncbi:unnamed protein product [Polarella glacialis]|uniref:Uncharacterized protein n=1 Tax=Polarella glacialis TaxID=89957 RepID=A0A813M7D8_POLGL|nr:unnamed protein product [Polarella glacialis]